MVYLGIGKINASYGTMRAIIDHRPKNIINLGTAGAIKKGLSGLIPISRLLQRDMDFRELDVSLGVIPFEDNSHEIVIAETGYSCG